MKPLGTLVLAFLAGCSGVAFHTDERPGLRVALEAAHLVRVDGPADVRISDRAYVRVEEGSLWIPEAQGRALLRAMGQPGDELLGLVVAETASATWYAVIQDTNRIAGWHEAPILRALLRR